VGKQGGHLEVPVPIAIGEGRLVVGRRLDLEPPAAEDGRERPVGDLDAGESRALAETEVEERCRLFDADRPYPSPQAGRAIERTDDDAHDEQRQEGGKPGRREDAEEAQPLEDVDHARTDVDAEDGDGVVTTVEVGHLHRVGGWVATQGEGRDLPDHRPDQPGNSQDDDLDHREPDVAQRPPDAQPEASQRVAEVGSSAPAERDAGDGATRGPPSAPRPVRRRSRR
jgi:hypothetical protein